MELRARITVTCDTHITWLLAAASLPLHVTKMTTVTCDTIQKLAFRRDRPHFDRFEANAATCQDYP